METGAIVSDLGKLGLTEADSRVYLLLMRHGTVTAGELAKISSYSRPKVYEIVDKLLTIGLVESFPGRPVKFRAFDPVVAIPALFSSKRTELNALENGLSSALKNYYEEVPSRENEVFINQGLEKSYVKYCELVQGAKHEIYTLLGWVAKDEVEPIYKAFKAAKDNGANINIMWFRNEVFSDQAGGEWIEKLSELSDRFHVISPEKTPIKNPPTKMLIVDDHSALIVAGDYLDDGNLKGVTSVHYHNVPVMSDVMKKLSLQFMGHLSGAGQ